MVIDGRGYVFTNTALGLANLREKVFGLDSYFTKVLGFTAGIFP